MLPSEFPERGDIGLYASMKPAKEVGGDFYDFFMTDDDHIALVVADMSGKGVPAALFMTLSKTLIKSRVLAGPDPAKVLWDVNARLCGKTEPEAAVSHVNSSVNAFVKDAPQFDDITMLCIEYK